MKKASLLVAAGIVCAGVTSGACAQGSVTLYGIIDTGLAYGNSVASSTKTQGAHRISAVTGFGSGDRWGLTGKEDLGGGLQAIFTLEAGFSGLTGASTQNRLFGRQLFVGLAHSRYGTFTMGRQYDYTFDYVAPLLSWLQFGSIYGTHIGDVDDTFQTYRLDNSVKYQVSPFDGLKLGALYAFSNQAAGPNGQGFANNRAYAFGASYMRGPLRIVSSFLTVSNPSAGLASSTNPNGAVGDEYSGATSIFYNAGFVKRQRIVALGAGYSFGTLNVNFVATDTVLQYSGTPNLRIDNYEINSRYQITPALSVGLGYIFTDGFGFTGTGANSYSTGQHPMWHQVDAGVGYALSKRTDVHMSLIYQRAAGDADTAAIPVFGPAGAGRTSELALVAGLRQRF
jgi:GBP family porin